MQFHTHLWTSALTGLLVYPRSPRRATLLMLAGVLIDADHYVVYGLNTGDWSITGAVRYNRYRLQPARTGDTRPRYGPLRSRLHAPVVLPLLWWLGQLWPGVRPLAYGITLHLLLDHAYLVAPRTTSRSHDTTT